MLLLYMFVKSLCSHKDGVLKFLDQLCSLYETSIMKNSSAKTENIEEFIEKVTDLADVNRLPSKVYKSLLTNFSVDDLHKQLNKVSDCLFFQCIFSYFFTNL